MRGNASDRRAVLLAELQDIQKNNRPGTWKGSGFTIHDWIDNGNRKAEVPHFLYLLETEGRKLSLETASVSNESNRQISILLMGDAQEWEAIKKDLTVEARINLAERFEIIELQSPNLQARQRFLTQLVNSPEIKRIGYRFDAESLLKSGQILSAEEAEEKLLGYFIYRTETLAQQFSEESISAFLKILTAFRLA